MSTTAWDSHRPPDPDLIADCVHCGFCLPTCPSYAVFEEEMDSPRGRIVLMRVGNEEGSEASDEMRAHFDRCLGCMACVTACPSGVKYDQLIERTRPQVERNAPRPLRERAYRKLIFALFTHPGRLRALVPLMWAQQKLGVTRLLARVPAARLAPPVQRRDAIRRLPEVTPAQGERRGRVALMQGCVQRVFFGDVNAATVRVLSAEGWEVHAPRRPRCCGALQLHAGVEDEAIELAKATIAAYEELRRGRGQRRRLRLGHEGLRAPARRRPRVGRARRRVLRPRARRDRAARRARAARAAPPAPAAGRVPRRLPPRARAEGARCSRASCCAPSPGWSCSSPPTGRSAAARPASTTSSSRTPRPSWARARRRTSSRPAREAVAAGNPGCALQIAAHLDGRRLPIYHPMTLLDHSIRGTRP